MDFSITLGMEVILGASLFGITWMIKTAIIAAAVYYLTNYLDGVQVKGYFNALLVAVVLSLLNATVVPILTFVATPITIITAGLFHFVIYAIMLLVADYILDGFKLKSFIWALILAVPLTVISTILDKML